MPKIDLVGRANALRGAKESSETLGRIKAIGVIF